MKGHHRVAKVVCFLNEGFPFAIHGQSPDIAGTIAGDCKVRSVRPELRHARLVKLDRFLLIRPEHVRIIECALRHPEPAARGPRELMRK